MNNSKKMLLINFIAVIALIFLDLYIKLLITPLKDNGPVVLIKDVLELNYLENRGAAFGILQGQSVFFLLIAIVIFVAGCYLYVKIPCEKKYIKLNIALDFFLAGALGNTIDRMYYGYVRDFIYFKLINFPIFNGADIYITCSTFWFVIMIIFCYKEDDLSFIFPKDKKGTRNA